MCILLVTLLKVGEKALVDLQAHHTSWQIQSWLYYKYSIISLALAGGTYLKNISRCQAREALHHIRTLVRACRCSCFFSKTSKVSLSLGQSSCHRESIQKPGTGLHQPIGRLVRKLAWVLDGATPLLR